MSDSSLKKGRFTKFSNRIGLYSNRTGNYIANAPEVVLNFPFKDTVLEAGMDKEDVGREERFLHLEIDKRDVDTLEEPKVLTNFQYVNKDGKTQINSNSDIEFFDEKGELKQNLLIKGNNLLGLYSLRQRLAGKVKLIYIDPPYNTQTEANTFAYNNSFNHSSWLTFMKNRLEVAKELLSDDGVIFIDIDHNELFYLGVLADEIFGQENRIGVLAVVNNLGGRFNKFFSQAHENKIVYAKDASKAVIKEMVFDNSDRFPYEDEIGRFKYRALQRSGDGSLRKDRPTMFYPIYFNPNTKDITLDKSKVTSEYVEILPIDEKGIERRWRWGKPTVEENWKTEIEGRKVGGEWRLYTKDRMKGEKPKTYWFKPEYSGATGTGEIKDLLGNKAFSYPKSVTLVKDSIQISTDPDDIVVDFFGGSGTTAQAVLEQNKEDGGHRKFVLVEQMDYINTVTYRRIENAIKKYFPDESFVYCELKKYNQDFLDRLMEVTSISDVEAVYEDMQKNAFLKFFFDKKEFEKDENFRSKTWEERRDMLVEILDENQLYLNLQDMRDSKHKVSNDEMVLTDRFYGVNEDAES